jgi:hypothetical protein
MMIQVNNQYVQGSVQEIILHLEKLMYNKHRCLHLAREVRSYNFSFNIARSVELAKLCGIRVKVIK